MDKTNTKPIQLTLDFGDEVKKVSEGECYSFTQSQKRAFDMFLQGKNMFITGEGGAGKSYLTKAIIDYCEQKKKQILVCAPTGIAAQNVGGATLHSTFRIDLKIQTPSKRCKDKQRLQLLRMAEVVIIDEISMCRLDVFNYVCNTLCSFRKRPQIIVVGDFFQLPPILSNRNNENVIWDSIEEYKGKMFPFESHFWTDLDFQTFELTEQVRQSEEDYIKCLNNIRMGVPDFSCFKQNDKMDDKAITLCSKNQTASDMNSDKLEELIRNGAKHRVYESRESGEIKDSDRQTEKSLKLCVGARVVFLVNDTTSEQYSNGEMGTVTDLKDNFVVIKADKGNEIILGRYEWEIKTYTSKIDEDGQLKIGTKKLGSFEQFPIKLAWAITVHKAQGQTYDRVNVIPENFFAEGQMYVALSRCKTKAGMHIIGQLDPWRVKCNNKVKDFMSKANR